MVRSLFSHLRLSHVVLMCQSTTMLYVMVAYKYHIAVSNDKYVYHCVAHLFIVSKCCTKW